MTKNEGMQVLQLWFRLLKKEASKFKSFFYTKNGVFIKNTFGFVIFYGILGNLFFNLIFNADISFINVFASGATYYLIIDFIKLLSEHKFILFKK